MKRQLTTRHLGLSVMVILGVLAGNLWAQPDFFEDFSDGDPADGSPVLWDPMFVWDGEGYTLTPEGLEVAGALLCNPDGTVPVYDDVALTTEIRRHANDTGAEYASGFLFRYNTNWTNGYWMEVRGPNRFLLGYSSGAVLASLTLPFNVDEQDLMIHMEAEGNQIKGWCWAVGQPMPEEPQISVVDSRAPAGRIALHAWIAGGRSIFRSVEVHSIKSPIVDLNGDGRLDVTDLAAFIDTWGQDDPITDYWNDGIVDIQDLEIFMDCWGKDVNDPTLLVHWALDEIEGDVAYDSVGLTDAILVGDPMWQPETGMVGGALQLDGENDYITAGPVVNPAEGPFSVLTWIKGGAPGQVMASQTGGQDWLVIDALDGTLGTGLAPDSRVPTPPLVSKMVVTDDEWHRIGLIWDGTSRALCADGVLVAEEAVNIPVTCTGDLNIGCDKDITPGTYFSGLIDDMRIYNRAVKP